MSHTHDQAPQRGSSIIEAPPVPVPGREAIGPGSPLPDGVRARMERSFAADFSDVRVHEGPQAAAVGAHAFAQGADLHFAPGRYDPHGAGGSELLGHELAHVVQHASGRAPGRPLYKSVLGEVAGDHDLEREADAMAARAARDEPARPAGAALLRARRDPHAAIHRMIDTDVPANGTRWPAIEAYLFKTLVNPRKQTFQQAVDEYIATGVDGAVTVKAAWKRVLDAQGKDDQANAALADIATIRTTINAHKTSVPDHPNKRGIAPARERYETIPQSADSLRIANELRADLLRAMAPAPAPAPGPVAAPVVPAAPGGARGRGRGGGGRGRGGRGGGRGRGGRGDGPKTYMLGVIVLPSGKVLVSHSGSLKGTDAAAFDRIVRGKGYQAINYSRGDYARVQNDYAAALGADAPDGGDSVQHKLGKDAVENTKERGNPLGVCAAPQGLHKVKAGLMIGDFPLDLTGPGQLAMTEVMVRDEHEPGWNGVKVLAADDSAQRYKGDLDVPSCLTCQHQLRTVMRDITDRYRNVLHRADIQKAEADRWALAEAAKDLATLLSSEAWKRQMASLHASPAATPLDVAAEVKRLGVYLDKYRAAIEVQAKERTKHPEFVEKPEPGKVPELKPLVAAERDARKQHDQHLWERRVVVGKLLDPEALNDAREERARDLGVEAPGEAEARAATADRARGELAKLTGYGEQRYLTPSQAELHRATLTSLLERLDASKRTGDGREPSQLATHRPDRVATQLDGALAALASELRVGADRVRADRADEALAAATQSSKAREASADDFASQMFSLAKQLAQYYESTFEDELARLAREDAQRPGELEPNQSHAADGEAGTPSYIS